MVMKNSTSDLGQGVPIGTLFLSQDLSGIPIFEHSDSDRTTFTFHNLLTSKQCHQIAV